MTTKMFYWPSSEEEKVEVIMEVCRDGFIYHAKSYSPAIDCMLDCTKAIRERGVWTERAEEFAQHEDWNDYGNDDHSDYLEMIKSSLRPA